MVNRVVLGAFDGTYVLRVSRPGFNVLSTGLTPEQLVFDSRWSEAGNVFLRGQVSVGNAGSPTQIMFGETFTDPPVVLLFRTDPNTANRRDPVIAEFVPSNWQNPVYLRNDSFYIRHEDGGTRTYYYACCRNLYG